MAQSKSKESVAQLIKLIRYDLINVIRLYLIYLSLNSFAKNNGQYVVNLNCNVRENGSTKLQLRGAGDKSMPHFSDIYPSFL